MAETGLGDGDGLIAAGVELVAPMAKEITFAYAVGAAEQHEASEGGALVEGLIGLLELWVLLLVGSGLVFAEGDGGGSPLMGVAVEGGVGGRTLTSGAMGFTRLLGRGCVHG